MKLINYNNKESNYYNSDRNDIFEYLPKNITNLLDVGCGNGGFAANVKQKLNIPVYGVESYSDASNQALEKLDGVYNYSAEESFKLLQDSKMKFDCITFNDVIEHLVDPYSVLSDYKQLLNEDGYIVISVPNLRKINILYDLLVRKDFKYVDAGILDRTHLRFFTKKSLLRMLTELGLKVVMIKGLNTDNSFSSNFLNILSFNNLEDTLHLQYLAVCQVDKNN